MYPDVLQVKVVLAAEPTLCTLSRMNVPNAHNCYEVFGFDVMLDDALKLWLIEVNTGPAMHTGTPLDKKVKNTMVQDMFHMVGFVSHDRSILRSVNELNRLARLTGVSVTKPTDVKKSSKTVGHSMGTPLRTARKAPLKAAEEMQFHKLNPQDLPDALKETESELQRASCTGFECVFPTRKTREAYSKYFETQRSNNVLTHRWVEWKGRHEYMVGADCRLSGAT